MLPAILLRQRLYHDNTSRHGNNRIKMGCISDLVTSLRVNAEGSKDGVSGFVPTIKRIGPPSSAGDLDVGRRAFKLDRKPSVAVTQRSPLAHTAALLLLVLGTCRSAEEVPCVYWAREGASNPTPEEQELQPRGTCASRRPDGRLDIDRNHLNALSFEDGLGSLLTTDGWYYVLPDGRNALVVTLDNGPDYFSEGLARTRRAGKVGFINRSLSEVIPPAWDFAFPFADGLAMVCRDCRSRPTADGEHSEMYGGSWGYIDRTGDVVVPVRFARDQLPAPDH